MVERSAHSECSDLRIRQFALNFHVKSSSGEHCAVDSMYFWTKKIFIPSDMWTNLETGFRIMRKFSSWRQGRAYSVESIGSSFKLKNNLKISPQFRWNKRCFKVQSELVDCVVLSQIVFEIENPNGFSNRFPKHFWPAHLGKCQLIAWVGSRKTLWPLLFEISVSTAPRTPCWPISLDRKTVNDFLYRLSPRICRTLWSLKCSGCQKLQRNIQFQIGRGIFKRNPCAILTKYVMKRTRLSHEKFP